MAISARQHSDDLARGLCVVLLFGASVGVVGNLFIDPRLAIRPGIAALAFAIGLGLSLRGYSPAARLWLMVVVQAAIAESAYGVGAVPTRVAALVAVMLPFLLFSFREGRALALGVLGALGVGVLVHFPEHIPFGPPLDTVHDPDQAVVVGVVTWLVVAVGAAWFSFTLHREAETFQAAEERARRANETTSHFLAALSHELRTPASALQGFGELLTAPTLSEGERRSHAEVVSRNAAHLLRLLDDLLDLSKVEEDHLAITFERVSLPELIHDVGQAALTQANERGVRIEIGVASPFPEFIRTDGGRLRQILLNLVGNAVKFTRDVAWLDVGVDDVTHEIAFAVRDRGPGISDEEISAVFQPFVQGAAGRHSGEGTGLGLALSRRLARALRGTLTVQSAMGDGTTFVVALPLGPEEMHAPRLRILSPPTHDRAPTTHAAILVGVRCLVAEDSPDLRQLLDIELSRRGARVVGVNDGLQAIEAIDVDNPDFDIVLMDVDMPRLDGLGATRELRSRGCELPIVALTAFAIKGDRERCLQAGCTAYLGKPVRMDDLATLIRSLAPATASVSGDTVTDATAEALRELTENFTASLGQRIAQMRALAAEGKEAEVAHIAHRLAGSAGSFGMPQVGTAARELERVARDAERSEPLEPHIDAVERAQRRPSAPPPA